jgi:hypothetical protein
MSARLRHSFACLFLATIAPLSGQSRAPKQPPHSTAVVRPLSLSTDPTPLLQAVADTTRAHIVVRLKAAGVVIVDRSQRLRGAELNHFVAAHFAIVGIVGMVDSQFVVVARLLGMDTGDSLGQVRLAGPPASAAVFGDSLGTLFAPAILGRPLAER